MPTASIAGEGAAAAGGAFMSGDFNNMRSVAVAGERHVFKFSLSPNEDGTLPPFRVSLVWHDAPASLQAAQSIVNDLDLKPVQ